MVSILAELRKIVNESGMSYDLLEEKSGVSKATISRIVSMKSDNPSLQSIIALADALDYDIVLRPTDSNHADNTQDIYHYRKTINEKDQTIAKLESTVSLRDSMLVKKNESIDRKDAYIRLKDDEKRKLENELRRKTRMIHFLSIAITILLMLLIYLFADINLGHFGFIRY